MTLDEEIDFLLENIDTIPDRKNYWMIRTQSGTLYDTFRENGIIGLEHSEVPLSLFQELRNKYPEDNGKIQTAIRKHVRNVHESRLDVDSEEELNVRKAGLIASQIFKFVFEIKKGDTVIIPSYNSDVVSFGIVTEQYLGSFNPEELRKIGDDQILRRRAKWIKDLRRSELDPFLYKMFTAHHALVEVGAYAEVIERSLKDIFVLDNEAHFVVNVQKETEIPARDLFGLGYEILRLVDDFAEFTGLNISSKDLNVTVNINSQGKFDLKSSVKKTTVVSAILLAAFGGGYTSKSGDSLSTPGIPGIIKAIDDFMTHQQDREIRQALFIEYKDSLEIKNPEDLIKLFKQFSDNKDLSK